MVLLEEVIYECIVNKKIAFSYPSCQETEPLSILTQFQKEDPLFINKQIAYFKLREEGWNIRDGIDYGCNYALYSDSVDSVHSLLLLTLSFNSEYKVPEMKVSNSLVLKTLHLYNNQYEINEIGKSNKNCSDVQSEFCWSFVQRMTRLASSQHKCWVIAFLSPSNPSVPQSLEQLQQIIVSSCLKMYSIEHWDPKHPRATNLSTVKK